jgi:hypothetical protein
MPATVLKIVHHYQTVMPLPWWYPQKAVNVIYGMDQATIASLLTIQNDTF